VYKKNKKQKIITRSPCHVIKNCWLSVATSANLVSHMVQSLFLKNLDFTRI